MGQGGDPPLPKMQHIHKELQKCTTLTHSAYTFVIMSKRLQCNSSFWLLVSQAHTELPLECSKKVWNMLYV